MHDEVGGAQSPFIAPSRWSMEIGGTTLRTPLLRPLHDAVDLIVGQASRSLQVAVSRFRLPGRHRSPGNGCADLAGARANVRVCEKGEGRRSAWSMARRTM